MRQIYSNNLIQDIVKSYGQGASVTSLSKNNNIPRSTIYYWINKYIVIAHNGNITSIENSFNSPKI
jgi:transposase-like protein